MKILITGSGGFVGTHLVKSLQKNHEIVSYDLKNGEDVLDAKKLSAKLNGCDVAIHLAAFVSATESWEKPYEYLQNNGLGTFNLVNECLRVGVKRVINFSSAAVYGNPLTPYGASKMWGENICEVYKNKIEIITFRPFNIYGSGQNPTYGYAIFKFIEGIQEKNKISIYGDGMQTRDFVYIGDVIKIVKKVLTASLPQGPIDLGTGVETKIIDLAHKIGKILNKDFKIEYLDRRDEPYKSIADTKKLKSLNIDVSGFINLDEGLRKFILNEN